jgi:DNA-binding response OmpR family regulator
MHSSSPITVTDRIAQASPMLRSNGDGSGELSILLVEDDPALQTAVAYNLRKEGYRVITADSGERALALVRTEGSGLDLVVLDLMLPGLNGFQVLRAIRQRLSTPVVLLSARGEEQDKVDGLELGADDYIVKPFQLREFLARIHAALRRGPSVMRPPARLDRGELRIEPEARRAAVGSTELHLRPKEFGLLLTLAMEPGKVFGRQELLDLVWGRDIIVDERTVDVHISWLRGKLTAAGLTDGGIRTVYGQGYRFESPPTVNTTAIADGVEHP